MSTEFPLAHHIKGRLLSTGRLFKEGIGNHEHNEFIKRVVGV